MSDPVEVVYYRRMAQAFWALLQFDFMESQRNAALNIL